MTVNVFLTLFVLTLDRLLLRGHVYKIRLAIAGGSKQASLVDQYSTEGAVRSTSKEAGSHETRRA